MNSEKGSKRTLRMLDLDHLVSLARIQGLYSTKERRQADDTTGEYHICPIEEPYHKVDEKCWCEPELVHEDECSKVYKHRRVQ